MEKTSPFAGGEENKSICGRELAHSRSSIGTQSCLGPPSEESMRLTEDLGGPLGKGLYLLSRVASFHSSPVQGGLAGPPSYLWAHSGWQRLSLFLWRMRPGPESTGTHYHTLWVATLSDWLRLAQASIDLANLLEKQESKKDSMDIRREQPASPTKTL